MTARDIGQSLIAATYSSRYTARNFWRDDVSGNSYQVQVQVPQPKMTEATDVELVPLTTQANSQQAMQVADSPSNPTPPLLIRDVARVRRSEMPGEVDRYLPLRLAVRVAAALRSRVTGGAVYLPQAEPGQS